MLKARDIALNATTTTILPTASDDSKMAPPARLPLVIDTTSPPPPTTSASTAPTGSRLFPNVDPLKLFPQGDAQPYDPTYRSCSGRETDHDNCKNSGWDNDRNSTTIPQGRQNVPGPDHDQRGTAQSNLPFNPYRPSRTSIADAHTTPGRIVSPRHIDRPRIATTTWISPHDIAGLANRNYHGGELGFYTLDCKTIHACGYTEINTADVIGSYNNIILVHEHIITNWEGCYTEGPQIDRILEKGLLTFPRLHSLTVEVAVGWYNKIQKHLMIYLIPVTPFDCVMIKMGYEALCILGTGMSRYPAVVHVLMELLPCILLHSDNEVNSFINMVRAESGNGYDLLW